ncbi:2-hydroxychromene-2-carboxylate isomerase [Zavarzinia compransoris]|uniref:2-hydroxychromene-2-carboxylate isomerase n=1 Tax=Zavarzinia compransoris TaxID=1264899 RepID=A0A317DWI2_9PROT|nr:2-hydroxychromene-2-carboxylate isomerase [Zavarzinia compransoris]PWR18891.1 disulfide bond formation protein DsbA [Zavarzinia compransoris]TDP48886.1 2-hydroxychromene-2-carboxylate isomerase [Zavarzinia compransoris]
MSKTVDFYFDFGSPTAYLAWRRIGAIAERTGATVKPVPILLGGLFKATGNSAPATVPAKGIYMFRDLSRFARRFGVPLAFNDAFPINTITLMRGAVGYQGSDDFCTYCDALYDAMWRDNRNLGDPAVLAAVLDEAGLDRARFETLVNDAAVKDRLKANTEDAVARGAFGAPTFFVGDEMFFGQDRLDFVEEALA